MRTWETRTGQPLATLQRRDDQPDALDRRLARLLHAALGKLEPQQRAAVLRRDDRHTLAEVADELGRTEAAAGALMRRTLRAAARAVDRGADHLSAQGGEDRGESSPLFGRS